MTIENDENLGMAKSILINHLRHHLGCETFELVRLGWTCTRCTRHLLRQSGLLYSWAWSAHLLPWSWPSFAIWSMLSCSLVLIMISALFLFISFFNSLWTGIFYLLTHEYKNSSNKNMTWGFVHIFKFENQWLISKILVNHQT